MSDDITISRHGPCWVLETRQEFPGDPQRIFDFFANAENLQQLTPPWLHFQILTPLPLTLREGSLIDYRLRLHGLPIRWRTRIVDWNPPVAFTDTQVHGPYSEWIHTHTFIPSANSVLMQDHVRYRVPGGMLVHWLLVQRDLRAIFQYRREVLRELLGGVDASADSAGIG